MSLTRFVIQFEFPLGIFQNLGYSIIIKNVEIKCCLTVGLSTTVYPVFVQSFVDTSCYNTRHLDILETFPIFTMYRAVYPTMLLLTTVKIVVISN